MVLIYRALLSIALNSVDWRSPIHTPTSESPTQGDSQLVRGSRLAQGPLHSARRSRGTNQQPCGYQPTRSTSWANPAPTKDKSTCTIYSNAPRHENMLLLFPLIQLVWITQMPGPNAFTSPATHTPEHAFTCPSTRAVRIILPLITLVWLHAACTAGPCLPVPVHWAVHSGHFHRPLYLTPLSDVTGWGMTYTRTGLSHSCVHQWVCFRVNLFTRALRDPSAQSFIHPLFHIFQSQIFPSIHLPIVNSSIRSFICSSVHSFIHLPICSIIHPSSQPLTQRTINSWIKPPVNSFYYLPFHPSIQPHPKKVIKCCDRNIPEGITEHYLKPWLY